MRADYLSYKQDMGFGFLFLFFYLFICFHLSILPFSSVLLISFWFLVLFSYGFALFCFASLISVLLNFLVIYLPLICFHTCFIFFYLFCIQATLHSALFISFPFCLLHDL